jgi:hypothetical protein
MEFVLLYVVGNCFWSAVSILWSFRLHAVKYGVNLTRRILHSYKNVCGPINYGGGVIVL